MLLATHTDRINNIVMPPYISPAEILRFSYIYLIIREDHMSQRLPGRASICLVELRWWPRPVWLRSV